MCQSDNILRVNNINETIIDEFWVTKSNVSSIYGALDAANSGYEDFYSQLDDEYMNTYLKFPRST